jgi:hypothetical protein
MKEIETGEDYKFRASLEWQNGNLVQVPCKLFLPKRVEERPRLAFLLNDQEFSLLARADLCKLTGDLGKDTGDFRIEASDLRIGSGTQRHWGNGLNEGYLLGHPRSLKLIQRIPKKAGGTAKATFMLTESRQLSPLDLKTYHSDGSIEWRRGERIQFQLTDDLLLTFDHQYRFDTSESPITHMWPELVATLDVGEARQSMDFEGLLPIIDELLLLVSLAEGQRCACLQAFWHTGAVAFIYTGSTELFLARNLVIHLMSSL